MKMSKEDLEHLIWIHNRLIEVHGENENYDYMLKLRSIIRSQMVPKEKVKYFISSYDQINEKLEHMNLNANDVINIIQLPLDNDDHTLAYKVFYID